jgi:hypothetical protein
MSSIEHQMAEIYCFIDDHLKAHPQLAHWRRSPNREPEFTDAEVIAIALMQGSGLGVPTLKKAYPATGLKSSLGFPPSGHL